MWDVPLSEFSPEFNKVGEAADPRNRQVANLKTRIAEPHRRYYLLCSHWIYQMLRPRVLPPNLP